MQNIRFKFLAMVSSLAFVTSGIQAAETFNPESQPTGWLAAPVVSDFNLSGGKEVFYRHGFFKDTWSGNVFAHNVSKDAVIQNLPGPWVLNTAASLLDAKHHSTGRLIATKGATFRWGSLTEPQQTALVSDKVLNYVRGDRANEQPNGESWRQREHVLGDILHSNIVYWDNGTHETLFVGANDGMLHAFDAKTGQERWAYVPTMVIPNLELLTKIPYVHTHFVDGPIRVANFSVSGGTKTMLVGGLGAGGKGLFGLDVSTHTAADETAVKDKILWEITDSGNFAELGYTYSTPKFARMSDGKPAVIIGNGYMSKSGTARLFIINAFDGSLIKEINTTTGTSASPNGLSSPTLYDSDGNGVPELAYAGDIDGNLWKFDLKAGTATKLFTTSPAQAITTAPIVTTHPLGGQMVAFATGRLLTTGDKEDTSAHYVYGIWDGAPKDNAVLLTQTLADSTATTSKVRTVTANAPRWASGSGNHYGWKVALREGERVVGEAPFHNAGRFYFLTTNPTVEGGENWIYELVAMTGGSPSGPIFDINEDGKYNSSDLAANGKVPVSKYLGSGIFSQPRLVQGDDLMTTLYVFHPDLPISDGVPSDPPDPGVSGGHFDVDIFYYGDSVTETVDVPTSDKKNVTICKKTKDVAKDLDEVAKVCEDNAPDGYTFLTDYITGAICKDDKDDNKDQYWQDLTCNATEEKTITSADYFKAKHTHEYDDKFDVTGVNFLNASNPEYNLSNAITDTEVEFKILVMNQYLNPAVVFSAGGARYENVKTYNNLATQDNASLLLEALPSYTMATIDTFVFNLPLDAFKNKDWWGDGISRAGLVPTQTGCVNDVDVEGVQAPAGKNGERFNGSITWQVIRADTPPGALELNGPDISYGWRVKSGFFTEYVLAEYLAFWHHPNKHCYHETAWIPDPPEDFDHGDKREVRAAGSADPQDGIFGEGLVIESTVVTESEDGKTVTTVITYSDDTTFTRIETANDDGSTTIKQVFRDGSEETVTTNVGRGGSSGYIDPNTGSPREQMSILEEGRQSWRDILN